MAAFPRHHPVHIATGSPGNQSADHDYSKGVKHLVETAHELQTSVPPEFILPVNLRPFPVSQASIPVVDLYGLHEAGGPRTRIVEDIQSACAEWGIFRIVNHGVKASLVEKMLSVVEEFFCLPLEEKMKYASSDVMNPVRYGTSLNTSEAHTRHWRDYLRHYGHPFESSIHLWPDKPRNYREVAKEYLEALWKLILELAGAISEGLGLGMDYFESFLGHGFQPIASNYYARCPQPHLTLGLAAHSDHGFLTTLMDNGVDGLQVKHHDKWVSIRSTPGTFLVNVGDCLEMLTDGRYKSCEHRAVVNKERARISVGVGSGPDLDAIIAPVSGLGDEDGRPKYKPIVYRDYVRLQQSIVTRGKTALQVALSRPSDDFAN